MNYISKTLIIFWLKFFSEAQDLHTIDIAALDCSGNEVAQNTISVHVCDVNDNLPWFDPESLKMEMCPDMRPPEKIGQLIGHDKDRGIYAKLQLVSIFTSW